MNNEVTDNHIQTESTRIKLVIDISKEVYEDIKDNFNKQKYCSCGEYLISSMIVFGTPLEELEKQKTGHWIKMPIGFKCSNCNELEDRTTKYCPNCGRRMVEPHDWELKGNNNEKNND